MVLQELGAKLTKALASVNDVSVVDSAVLDACLKEISAALLQADVNVKLVFGLRTNVKKRVEADSGVPPPAAPVATVQYGFETATSSPATG
jgi:signal recognition particle subunit SRP54